MGYRKIFLARFIFILLLIGIFYFCFWILWSLAWNTPWQLFLAFNLFNILMVFLLCFFEVLLWMALDFPDFRKWLLTIERNPRSKKEKKPQKTVAKQKAKKEKLPI